MSRLIASGRIVGNICTIRVAELSPEDSRQYRHDAALRESDAAWEASADARAELRETKIARIDAWTRRHRLHDTRTRGGAA